MNKLNKLLDQLNYEDGRNKAAMIGVTGQMLYNIHNTKQNMILKFQDKMVYN